MAQLASVNDEFEVSLSQESSKENVQTCTNLESLKREYETVCYLS